MFSSNTSQVSGGGYQISRSLRFNSADSAYLNRTPAGAGNRTTWTWSGWAKLGALSTSRVLFSAITGSNETTLYFDTSNRIDFYDYASSAYTGRLQTTQVFRDPSAWYHIVAVWNSGNATAGDRMRLYINGSEVTAFGIDTNPALNTNSVWNQAIEHRLGGYSLSSIPWDGYMTEVNFIDGQALTPSSFGETNAQTGVWQPKAYSGSYGTNGFYLNFSDNSNTTAATLGKDYSGNGNNWTPNNFSVSAGAGNDSLVDTPTPYGVDTGAGGEVRGNYCTLNAVDNQLTLANGNLDASRTAASWRTARSTLGMSTGKWYWEMTCTGANLTDNFFLIGIANNAAPLTDFIGNNTNSFGYYNVNGLVYYGSGTTAYGNTWQTNDVIGVAFDADAGKIWFAKNGTWQNSGSPTGGTNAAFTGIVSNTYFAAISQYSLNATATSGVMNFGQRPFAYTAPSGFKALCTQNLPTPTIGATTATQAGNYFVPTAYTGNGSSSRAITNGINMAANGGLVWTKQRSGVEWHFLIDNVRGNTKYLSSNATNAEGTISTLVTGFDSTGYSIGNDSGINSNGSTYVSWVWGAGGSGVTNTAGSITSTVSANTTSGFSIATWTGTGSGTATIGHGLGVAPSMIIVKFRNTTSNWSIYHASLGNTKRLVFTTAAEETGSGYWNNTTPTSTVFTLGTDLNQAYNFVAYCFAEVPGYSKFGSYTGNGSSDGPFVYCGFRPKYVLVKQTDISRNWWVFDGARNPSNVVTYYLAPDLSDAENTFNVLDFTSNGFKWRDSSGGWNQNGGTYIFMAFAESPFKYSLAR